MKTQQDSELHSGQLQKGCSKLSDSKDNLNFSVNPATNKTTELPFNPSISSEEYFIINKDFKEATGA